MAHALVSRDFYVVKNAGMMGPATFISFFFYDLLTEFCLFEASELSVKSGHVVSKFYSLNLSLLLNVFFFFGGGGGTFLACIYDSFMVDVIRDLCQATNSSPL